MRLLTIAILLVATLAIWAQEKELQPSPLIDGNYSYQLIIAPNGDGVLRLRVDDYGVFTNAGGDTLAVSCELTDILMTAFLQTTHRTPTVDSAYLYRAEAMFYRKWFGDNITPNPLKPRPKFKEN
mgnify:CR=1 FL=1